MEGLTKMTSSNYMYKGFYFFSSNTVTTKSNTDATKIHRPFSTVGK